MTRGSHLQLRFLLFHSLVQAESKPVLNEASPLRVPNPEFSTLNGPNSREFDAEVDFRALIDSVDNLVELDARRTVTLNLPGEQPFETSFKDFIAADCCFDEDALRRLIVRADPDAPLEDFNFTWRGKGEFDEDVVIAVRNGQASGFITTKAGMWRVYYNQGSERHIVRYIDETNYPSDGVGQVTIGRGTGKRLASPILANPIKGRPSQKGTTDQRQIDLPVLYTNAARIEAATLIGSPVPPPGNTAAIDAVIDDSLNQINTAFDNSLVTFARASIASSQQTGYVEGTNSYPDHLEITRDDPGVIGLRNANEADVVMLVVSEVVDTSCGFAYVQRTNNCGQGLVTFPEVECNGIGPQFESYAFAVVNVQCAADRADFAHELGHVLGLEHDPQSFAPPPADASFPWSFGACFPGAAQGDFRTILGNFTVTPCGAPNTPRQLYFSSNDPNVTFNGFMTGDANQDNARTLMISTEVVSQYRGPVGVIFRDSFEQDL